MNGFDRNKYPLTHRFVQNLVFQGMKDNFWSMWYTFGNVYLEFCEEMLKIVDMLGYDGDKAYLKSTLLYLKDKARFEKNGKYNNGSFDEIRENVYNNKKKMEEVYLPGMFLSYPFAAILYVKYNFYLKEFIPLLSKQSKGIDIGFGPGFYIWQSFKHCQDVSVTGYDISQYSVYFSNKLLKAMGVNANKYKLLIGNLCDGINDRDNSYDWCILTEVLEHVPEPITALAEIHKLLKPNGVLFMTTVIDSNHYDHLTNFSNLGEIERLIADAGLTLLRKNVYIVKDEMLQLNDETQSLAFICRK